MSNILSILAIETSTNKGSVALLRTKQNPEQIIFGKEMDHGRMLLPSINDLLQNNKLSVNQVDVIAISNGPGSYTGLRIGLATAKAIALTQKVHIVTIPTHDVIAFTYLKKYKPSQNIGVITDARSNLLFLSIYEPKQNTIHQIKQTKLMSYSEVIEEISSEMVLIGEAVNASKDITVKSIYPEALSVAELGLNKYNKGEIADPITVIPNYMKKTQPEINLERGQYEKI